MVKKTSQKLWDIWCIVSIIGIWPRYIEPELLSITRLFYNLPSLAKELSGFKILQFSDLHWNHAFSDSFANRLIKKIAKCKPDLIVFTGDFLCRAQLEDRERLKRVLQTIQAPYGCFAVLGNHDYSSFVTVNERGDYDIESVSSSSEIRKGFTRLFSPVSLTQYVTERARQLLPNKELLELLKETPFQLLNNQTVKIDVNGAGLNICGLEEYSLGRFNPKLAFENYDNSFPGVILSHNPDAFSTLQNYPGEIVLCGHTHGGQVNLPWLWKRFTRIKNLKFKSGLRVLQKKWLYINRGISSVMKFRWFSIPEISLITLQRG